MVADHQGGEYQGRIMVHGHIMNLARRLQLAAAVILVALSGGAAWSQATRTITVIVPYQPGGATDVLARVLAAQIGRAQGPTILIENRPGRARSLEPKLCRAPRQMVQTC
jgi:hypothetical protein